jgi:hypothetical protein
MSHELLHSLQIAGWPNVPVSCHSCDSLLHWIVAWQTTSSEPQFEHTGVERAGRPVRSSIVRGTSGIKLNGLMSAVRRICFIPLWLGLRAAAYTCDHVPEDYQLRCCSLRCELPLCCEATHRLPSSPRRSVRKIRTWMAAAIRQIQRRWVI